MHGAGNDYIYFDGFDSEFPNPEAVSVRLSDRHFGIGGDGIVLICRSAVADARMRMFNADGSEGKMCGNAIRCVAKWLYERKGLHQKVMRIETLSGIKRLELQIAGSVVTSVTVDMGTAELRPERIPVLLEADPHRQAVIDRPLRVGSQEYRITCVSMGNPHAVVFCDAIDGLELPRIGSQFEKHALFPEGVNTEFIQVIDADTLKMRVWERGSGETLACGTGACAAVVAATLNGYCAIDREIKVVLKGGDLRIRYSAETVLMTGGCVDVFDGTVLI